MEVFSWCLYNFRTLQKSIRMKCLSFSSVSFAPLSLDATNLQLNSQLFCFFYAKRESIHIRSSLSSDISRFRRCGCFYKKSFGSLRWRGVRQKCLAMEEQCWHQFSYIESRPWLTLGSMLNHCTVIQHLHSCRVKSHIPVPYYFLRAWKQWF